MTPRRNSPEVCDFGEWSGYGDKLETAGLPENTALRSDCHMNEETEKRIAARLAKTIAMI